MVDRFTSKPIDLPDAEPPVVRADLLFYGLDHSRASYEARIFFDARDVDQSAGPDHPAYVGSFFIFGHGGCFGDEGHCDLPAERDPFDLRPPHQLEPAARIVTVTDPVARLIGAGRKQITVTVVVHAAEQQDNNVLTFDTVRLATYT